MNTIKIIYQKQKREKNLIQKMILLAINLFGATLISWFLIVLVYEVPCTLGKLFDLDNPIVRAAVRADKKVTMKYRTRSYAVNKITHELEEMKEFYSQI